MKYHISRLNEVNAKVSSATWGKEVFRAEGHERGNFKNDCETAGTICKGKNDTEGDIRRPGEKLAL